MTKKIEFIDFERIMLCDISKKNNHCIEIAFCVDDSDEFQDSWMGKMLDADTKKPVFWLGLTPDGSQAYDFNTYSAFINAKFFRGKSICQIWDSISIYSLDGGLVEEMLPFYSEQEQKY